MSATTTDKTAAVERLSAHIAAASASTAATVAALLAYGEHAAGRDVIGMRHDLQRAATTAMDAARRLIAASEALAVLGHD